MKYRFARGVILCVVFLIGASAVRAADPPGQTGRELRDELEKLRTQQKELAEEIERLSTRLAADEKPLADRAQVEAYDRLIREVCEQRDQSYQRIRRLETEVALLRDAHPFTKLNPGMTEAEVVKLIGKPERVSDEDRLDGSKWVPARFATYLVQPSDGKSRYLLTVEYRKGDADWVYRDWAGPHIPE